MVCNELHNIQAPADKKRLLIRIAAREAFKTARRRNPKLADVIWKEMKICYPDIIIDEERPGPDPGF